MKFVYIGAGSPLFGYETTRDILRTAIMKNSELCLVDINKKRLELQLSLAEKVNKLLGSRCKIKAYTNHMEALPGAHFVIVSISVGGYPAELVDGCISRKYGISQDEIETVGPGGLSHAFRTIPLVVKFARSMEKVCPQAVMINYSNPMSSICLAVSKYTGIRVIGLCHELFHLKKALRMKGLTFIDKVKIKAAGVNHFTWIISAKYKRKNFLPELIEYMERLKGVELSVDNYHLFGFPTVSTNVHVSNFFPYVLQSKKLMRKYKLKGFRNAYRTIMAREKDRLRHIKELLNDGKKISGELDNPSEDMSVPLAESIVSDKKKEFIVNVPNRGYIDSLPEESVVEVPARVGRDGAFVSSPIKLEETVATHLNIHCRVQKLVIKAAVEHDCESALKAFLLDPVCGISEDVFGMFNSLLESQKRYIPELYKGLVEDGIQEFR